MPDFHVVLFDYHGIPVYVRLDLGCETPELARFMGPKGILDAGEFDLRYSPQRGIDTAPSYYSGSFPGEVRDEYVTAVARRARSSARPGAAHQTTRSTTVTIGTTCARTSGISSRP